MKKNKTIFVLLLIALPLGIYISNDPVGIFYHRYYDGDFGYYHGYFQLSGNIINNYDFTIFFIEGRTPSKWHWQKPKNYKYSKLLIKEGSILKGELSLPSLTFKDNDSSFVLTQEKFNEIMLGKKQGNISLQTKEQLAELFDLIKLSGKGELPPPKHHPYYWSDDPDRMLQLTHFSLGSRYHYSVLIWILIWISILIYFIIKRKKLTSNQEDSGDGVPPPQI